MRLRLEHSRYFEVKDGGYVLAVRVLEVDCSAAMLVEAFSIGGADTLAAIPTAVMKDP